MFLIKNDADGSTVYIEGGDHYDIKIFPVELMKSFGGRNAYAFIYDLVEGWDLIEELEFGSGQVSMLVSTQSCSEAISKDDEIKNFSN